MAEEEERERREAAQRQRDELEGVRLQVAWERWQQGEEGQAARLYRDSLPVSALEEPSGWATGWEWLDTLDAGEREWLLRALWFNCDEVRAARMPRRRGLRWSSKVAAGLSACQGM